MEFRILTREEAATVPGMVDPQPESLRVVGAVDENGVVACIGLFLVLHADPIWVRPDKRHSGKLLLRLWNATKGYVCRERLAPEILASMTKDKPGPELERVVERLWAKAGGEELDARFCVLPVR